MPNIYSYISILIKLHSCPLFLLKYFAFNSSGSEIYCSIKESPDFGTTGRGDTVEKQPESSQGGFCCFFPCYWKLMGKLCISHVVKYTIGWESDGRKAPIFGESMGTNFLGSPNPMDFAAFSYEIGN